MLASGVSPCFLLPVLALFSVPCPVCAPWKCWNPVPIWGFLGRNSFLFCKSWLVVSALTASERGRFRCNDASVHLPGRCWPVSAHWLVGCWLVTQQNGPYCFHSKRNQWRGLSLQPTGRCHEVTVADSPLLSSPCSRSLLCPLPLLRPLEPARFLSWAALG